MKPYTVTASGPAEKWVGEHADELRGLLLEHGAVLLTGAPVQGPAELARVRDAFGATPAVPHEQFATRRDLGDGVYAAHDWAADREMCHHHEQSYAAAYPRLLLMAGGAEPAGGVTLLLGDTRRVLDHLPSAIVEKFRAEGWLLIRNYRPYLGLKWAAAFGVDTPAAVEERCAQRRIEFTWERDGSLRTKQRRAAIVEHPVTGETCWFNDIAFLNQWAVDDSERGVLLKTFGAEGMPLNTFYGDGEPLDEAAFKALLDAYDRTTRRVTLAPGELLLVDNILTAHGREPYTGEWDLAVALADPVTAPGVGFTGPP